MISLPVYNQFHVYFDKNFLMPEVESRFMNWFKSQDVPFLNMVSFLNNSIINFDIPGIATAIQEQNERDGSKRSYAGGLPIVNSVTKKISLSFKIQNNYFSYFLLRSQISEFVDRRYKQKDFVLPAINLDILDDYGNIIFKNVYKDIVFESINGISFKKTDLGISYKDFTCNFRYTSFEEFSPIIDQKYIDRKQEYIY